MEDQLKLIDVGYRLQPLVKKPTTEKMCLYASRYKGKFWETSIHTSEEEARKVGLSKPLCEGMFLVNYISELLSNTFRERWFETGEIAVSFLHPVFYGYTVTANGMVRQKVEESLGTKIVLHVWLEDGQGEKALVGRASVLIGQDK